MVRFSKDYGILLYNSEMKFGVPSSPKLMWTIKVSKVFARGRNPLVRLLVIICILIVIVRINCDY